MDSQQRTSSAFASRCDSAGCLFVDRRLVVAAEAERFRRIKRWAGLLTQAIDSCLREAGLTINELDHIAVNRISSLANATRAINASSRRSLVGFDWQRRATGLASYPEWTKQLQGQEPYGTTFLHGKSGASHRKQNRGPCFSRSV